MNPNHSRLLLVGNSVRSRQDLREFLTELGAHQIDEATDVLTAFALHQRSAYDLIVCEWDLPKVNGIELLRAIRRGSTRSKIAFVLATGEKVGARTVEALQSGANGVLELPLTTHRTREKVNRIIGAIPEVRADLWSPSA